MAEKDVNCERISDSDESVTIISIHSGNSELTLAGDDVYMVERLVGKRKNPETGVTEYRVKWDGYPASDNTWEPKKNLQCYDLIREFEARELEKSKKQEKKTQERIDKRKQRKQAEEEEKLRLKDKLKEQIKKIKERKQAKQEEKLQLKENISTNVTIKKEKTDIRSKSDCDSTVVAENVHVPGFKKSYAVEKIIGASRDGGELKYLIKFKEEDEPELVINSICHEKYPQDLIAYLERTLAWSTVVLRD